VAGQTAWNSLPHELRATPALNSFKRKLKTNFLTPLSIILLALCTKTRLDPEIDKGGTADLTKSGSRDHKGKEKGRERKNRGKLKGRGEWPPFLPARRYASAGLCDSDVSVRLSARLSHAGIVPSRAKAGS